MFVYTAFIDYERNILQRLNELLMINSVEIVKIFKQ